MSKPYLDPRLGNTVRYANDPLRGDKRAHAILRLHKGGASPRRIAKVIGIGLDVVREELQKAGVK